MWGGGSVWRKAGASDESCKVREAEDPELL